MAERIRREVLWLVALVIFVDLVFAAAYFLTGFGNTTDATKIAFTAVWTLVTLGVVLRSLARIRRLRVESRDAPR